MGLRGPSIPKELCCKQSIGELYPVAVSTAISPMTYLEKAVANGFAQKSWIENDDDLNSLHDMPRFKALLARMK